MTMMLSIIPLLVSSIPNTYYPTIHTIMLLHGLNWSYFSLIPLLKLGDIYVQSIVTVLFCVH